MIAITTNNSTNVNADGIFRLLTILYLERQSLGQYLTLNGPIAFVNRYASAKFRKSTGYAVNLRVTTCRVSIRFVAQHYPTISRVVGI